MKNSTCLRLAAGAFLGGALLAGCSAASDVSPTEAAKGAATVAQAPEFQGLGTWFNTPPLTLEGLRGKVVLVDFWTFDCINCLNHLPAVKEWHRKYKDQGLVVVGIHTPEFPFEKPADNVRKAIGRLGIEHAVAQDNGYQTWKAFHNQYWPATYLIDKSGRIVYRHFGEGRYQATERKLQELLAAPAPARAG